MQHRAFTFHKAGTEFLDQLSNYHLHRVRYDDETSDFHGRVPDVADLARYTAASLVKRFTTFRLNIVVYPQL